MSAAPTMNGCARPSRITKPEHETYCTDRGIPLSLAETAGWQTVDKVIAGKLLGSDKPCKSGGLAMPYPDTCPPYVRVRMDEGGPRYLCPKARPVPVYKPPPHDAPCPSDLADLLLVVESPAKALCMVAHGLNAVGLGGVATTLRPDGSLHPSWGDVTNLDVRILFDENAASNENVQGAERRLASALELAGARVRICRLPQWSETGKAGPDDYVVEQGVGALYDVVRSAERLRPDAATPASVFAQWRTEGPLVHEPTGFPTLDELTGGGPAYGCRVYTPGAPDAGKTGVAVHVGHTWAKRGIAVGFHAIDEEPSDYQTRLAQREGFTRKECETRDPLVIAEMESRLGELPILYFGSEHTIERAAEDLAAFAKSRGITRMALFEDSIQLTNCEATVGNDDLTPREVVTRNVQALRKVATKYRLIGWGISEMNRGAYRSVDAAENSNDMASGAESRAIEFSARVMLALRSVKDHGDLVEVRVVKNKLGPAQQSLYLQIDRQHMTFEETDAPKQADHEAERDARGRERVAGDAAAVALIVAERPGLGVNALYSALRAKHGSFSEGRADAGLEKLGRALVRVPAPRRGFCLHLAGAAMPPDVMALVPLESRPRIASSCAPGST